MRILSLKRFALYGVAVLNVGIATEPLLGESASLLLFAIAVILTSWFGGFWPGLLTIILSLLSLLAIDYSFFAPKDSIFSHDSRLDQIRAVSFGIFVGLPILIFALIWEILKKVADRRLESVEQARAARNLRESEERYRAFIANSSEGIWRFELEQPIPVNLPENEQIDMLYRFGYLAECNDAMARVYGYETADQIVGARIGDLLPRSDPWNIAHIRAFRRSGFKLTDSESHEVDRYGNTRYFLKNLIGIVENGAVVRAWGTQRDITERKEAEEERRESEERYRLLTEISPDGVFIAGVDGTVHLANQSMQRMLGVKPEQVIGRNFWDFFPPRCVNKYRDCLTDLMADTPPEGRIEIALRRDDGRILPVEVSAVRFDWKGRRFAQFVIHDISQHKHAEAERERLLKEIEAERNRLRQILEQLPIGVYIAEAPSGRPIFCNHEAESLLRHPLLASEDYRGYAKHGALREDGSPYRAEDYPLARSLISGETIKGEEIRYRRGDGTETFFSVDSAPINDSKGRRVLAVATFIDIAERKQAEEALSKSEERFAKAFRVSPDGLLIARLADAVVLEVNDSFVSLSGYDRDEMIGNSTIDLGIWVDPADRQRALAIMKERNYVRDFEFAMRRKSGEKRIVRFSAEPLELHGERCWLAVSSDITERKQAEDALRESEERFSKAFRASPYGLAITRQSDGVILEVNDSWLQLFGYESDEVIGKSWTHFEFALDTADRRRARAIVGEQGYLREFEMAANQKSGETIMVRLSIEPIELRGERCMVTIVNDITQRKQAEEALRESEEQARRQLAYLEAIYATAPVGLCFVDTDLRYLSMNERLAEINGRSVKEHIGRTVRDVSPEAADTLEPVFRRVIETGEPALNVEQSVAPGARPGVTRHFIANFYPIKNGGGRMLGVNVVVMEITERKKIEEEREHLLREEKAAREEAESANRMKNEFLATISHELRTPLTSILGWARMLTGRGLTTPQARHALDVIAQSAQSQAQLIEDILDTSGIITGHFKLDTQPVAIEQVFHAAVDVIRPGVEAKGIVLSEVVEAPDGVVLGDDNRLRQAVWNLLSNAVKFTSKGGRIEARLGRAEGQIEITVKDTGIGIDPKFLPHVFERFRQADASSTREYGGLGIGLSIVRHIVEMHGGGVSASSPGKGQGATFKIRLPLISAPRMERPEGPRVEAPTTTKERKILEISGRLDGLRVLLVEDNEDTLDMLKFIFEESGAEVITATSVDDALEALERFSPGALVSDIAMPDRDGYDLIREVRSREPERGGKIPAVAVTAYTRAEDRVRVLAAGFQMHIAKPIAPGELIAVVASLTGHIDYGRVLPNGKNHSLDF